MDKEFIITSTNNIEGGKVIKYYGVINNNIVVGTNLFSDIGASFLDIFGGTSSSYQTKLKNIYDTSIQNLKVKARNSGANAILGLSIDFDEISGGGKSMFMISVSGTAVSVDYSFATSEKNSQKLNESISNEVLLNELTKKQIINNIKSDRLPTQEEWYFIQQNPIVDINENLLDTFLTRYEHYLSHETGVAKKLITYMINYLRVLDKETSTNLLYDKLNENSTHILTLLESSNLFSPTKVLGLLENGELEIAINCLNINKENYSNDDVAQMNKIIKTFENLEDKGSIQTSKNLLGKEKEVYICPKGHSNDIEYKFCTSSKCNLNIKGLTSGQVEIINKFKTKVETLSSLFAPN